MKKLFYAVFALALLLCAVWWSQGSPLMSFLQGNRGTISIPNFTANGGLPKWKACLAKVKAGAGDCNIMLIGESTTAAFNATWSGTTKDALSAGTPNQLAGILSTYYSVPALEQQRLGQSISSTPQLALQQPTWPLIRE